MEASSQWRADGPATISTTVTAREKARASDGCNMPPALCFFKLTGVSFAGLLL